MSAAIALTLLAALCVVDVFGILLLTRRPAEGWGCWLRETITAWRGRELGWVDAGGDGVASEIGGLDTLSQLSEPGSGYALPPEDLGARLSAIARDHGLWQHRHRHRHRRRQSHFPHWRLSSPTGALALTGPLAAARGEKLCMGGGVVVGVNLTTALPRSALRSEACLDRSVGGRTLLNAASAVYWWSTSRPSPSRTHRATAQRLRRPGEDRTDRLAVDGAPCGLPAVIGRIGLVRRH
ncbi:MAG TPA: hypothetical protein VK046_02380 [Actinomycetaceae bacterium]|nr:hypothetical protein [Actinomycetaceae bacterium]